MCPLAHTTEGHVCAQVVLAGCEGEVHMYSLFVDDTAEVGKQAVAGARRSLALEVEPLPQASCNSGCSSVSTLPAAHTRVASLAWRELWDLLANTLPCAQQLQTDYSNAACINPKTQRVKRGHDLYAHCSQAYVNRSLS